MSAYGPDHRRWRRTTPKPEGDPCPRCGLPMWPDQRLDAGHVVDSVFGGDDGPRRWEHAKCNQAAGASLGGRLRSRKPKVVRSRKW